MAFTPKSWHDTPATDTPISAAALQDLETRLSNIGLGGFTTQTGAAYTAQAGDVVLANPVSGAITVTLPTPTQSTTVTVVAGTNISATNQLTVAYGSAHIRGAFLSGAVSSFTMSTPITVVQLTSDGTDWYCIAGNALAASASAATPTGTFTAGVASAQLVAANSSRRALRVWNLDPVAIVYGSLGSTAILQEGFVINPNGCVWGTPSDTGSTVYTGAISVISTLASTALSFYEL